MTADELIRSGLLEAYVLGQCTPQEVSLVEGMRASDASVRTELDAIELAMEQQAMAQAVAPAPALKATLMDRIRQEAASKAPRVIPIARDRKPFSWLAAASVAALLLSVAMNFMQYRELREVRTELAQLQEDRSVLAEEMQVLRTNLDRSQNQLAVVMDPRMRTIMLDGMGTAKGHRSRVYWDQQSALVHFDALSLPPAPQGSQYQLWALVDGQPVDAGMVPLDSIGLARMKDIPNAQAFAVTIEPLGGKPAPTLEAMVLLGYV